MKPIITTGIILSRTDFGEADRILTLLTPDYGKLRLMAKGVRRAKSKLAGGIELFSVSDITFMRGRGDIGTLVSTRLEKHYGRIVENIERTMLGYDLIKKLNKATEDEPEPEYFELMQQTFEALDDDSISIKLINFWFAAQLLRLYGHTPNLQTDTEDRKLAPDEKYNFDGEHMAFIQAENGRFSADHIKFLRLNFSGNQPKILQRISGAETLADNLNPVISQLVHL